MTIFYKKVGRRYVAVNEYDPELMDSLPPGDHLVSIRTGQQSRRHNIDPALAPMIAAGLYAEDAMSRAIYNAMELRPHHPTKITKKQRALIDELTVSMNRQDAQWLRPCARDAAEAGIRALQQEAERRLRHPAVREAYEQFLLVAKLCEEKEER